MKSIQDRLEKCFSLALPGLPKEAISRAAMNSVAQWDSLATVNILSLIEEEFGIQVPDSDLENFRSFEQILQYLTSRQAELS
jgi:acyl carrier protein